MKNTLGEINSSAKDYKNFILECDREYNLQIKELAKKISKDKKLKVVAISGPSASGKTTTAHLLAEELKNLRENAAVVSLDDFYKTEKYVPRFADGAPDYETVDALDKELIKECLSKVIESGETYIPSYDFKTHTRENNAKFLNLGKNGIIIFEGLHALNTEISGLVPKDAILKIYISVNISVEDENGVGILSSRQVRLVRRIVRDSLFRAADIKDTLKLWNSVVDGEVKYLYPFSRSADVKISTFHPFELCVYKKYFCKMRNQVDKNTLQYDYFIKTVNAMELFAEIPISAVPKNSLISEFISVEK